MANNVEARFQFNVLIPVDPSDEDKFRMWTKHYGMEVLHKRGSGPYWNVYFNNPVDLYWLGANMFGDPTNSIEGMSKLYQHGPDQQSGDKKEKS